MGCAFGTSSTVAVVHRCQEPDVITADFSETQIDTIRSTWPLLSRDSVRVGTEVFSRIFRESPSIHTLFQSFDVQNVEDLHRYPVFCEHANKFMQVLGSLVDNLEAPSTLDDDLALLGAKHATFQGYHLEYFRLYTKCLLEVWEVELGEEFIQEVRDSWTLAFDYIVKRMTAGFNMCLSGQIYEIMNSFTAHAHSSDGCPTSLTDALSDQYTGNITHAESADDMLLRVQ